MFDIGWSELVLIGAVALVVIGPKELPGVLRTVGGAMTKIRRMAAEFQGQIQEAMREAEMDDARKTVDDLNRTVSTGFNPIQTIRDEIRGAVEGASRPVTSTDETPPAPALNFPEPPIVPDLTPEQISAAFAPAAEATPAASEETVEATPPKRKRVRKSAQPVEADDLAALPAPEPVVSLPAPGEEGEPIPEKPKRKARKAAPAKQDDEGSTVPPEERGVGLMFQDYALFPHLDVLQNVLFGLRALSTADAQTAARRALSRVGMESYVKAYPHMLSGGEQQRVALARAVAPRPGVILMDEPFSNLDRRMRDAVREETVTLLREMGATTIIVTHDPEEAMRIADRVVLMRGGAVVQAGPAAALYGSPVDLATARFFCDFNEVDGEVKAGRAETTIGLFAAPGLPDGPAVVCIRPQGVRLRAEGFCIPGRVLSRRFLGEVDLFEVAVQGLDAPLRARLRGHAHAVDGANVGVDIDPDEVLVFAAPGA